MLRHLSTKTVLALQFCLVLVVILLVASELRVWQNPRLLELKARGEFCDTVSAACSILASRGDYPMVEGLLRTLVDMDQDDYLLSAALRQGEREIVAETSGHAALWGEVSKFPEETHITIPVVTQSDNHWGDVLLRFKPVSQSGLMGLISQPLTLLLGFVVGVAFFVFYVLFSKQLKAMSPSKSVPQRVRTALNTLANGLVVIDARGDIVMANEALAKCLGEDADSLIGKPVSELPWAPVSVDQLELPWAVTLHTQLPQTGISLRLMGPKGERTFIVNSSPMIGTTGELRGVFIGLEDVTILEQKEVELKKSKDEAERANSAKTEFLARMSHEIRTPMNAILGFTDVLRRGFDQDVQEREEYLNTIHSSGEHLLALINDILDLSKVESGKIEFELCSCSPHKIILEVLQVLAVRAEEKGLHLAYEPYDSMPESVTTDPVRLRQIVTNLVGNALKFTELGGVHVVARIEGNDSDAILRLDIVDSGIGIQTESLERIFEPFSQADNSITRKYGGTGLGLAICKRFAEALGGSISVASEVGRGTVFTVRIAAGDISQCRRISKAQALESIQQRQTAESYEVSLPSRRILIVDDGDSNRKLLSLFLSRAGAVLDTAVNGQEAVNKINSKPFDVVLMDMQMPVMDGYTAASILRAQGHTVPIVALTAHAMKQDEDKCIAAGCSHFLPKPIDSNRLMKLLAEILGGTVMKQNSEVNRSADPISKTTAKPNHLPAGPIVSQLPLDEEFQEIIVEFVDRLGERLQEMEQALESNQLLELASMAHWLKGSGGTAGFHVFTEPARSLELLSKEGRVSDIPPVLNELHQLHRRICIPEFAARQ